MRKFSLLVALALVIAAPGYTQSTSLTLPTTDNTSSFDVNNSGSANLLKVTGNGQVGIGQTEPRAQLEVGGLNGILSTGTFGSGDELTPGAGARLHWYPKKAAFRAGYVDDTQWDEANIGNYSTAMGYCTTASSHSSTAIGCLTTASGTQSAAIGRLSRATGLYSYAFGSSAHADALYSTAIGHLTTANGESSLAMGHSTTADGESSIAMGAGTTASGESSTAMGNATNASNSYSTAMGVQTLASGIAATAMGQKTTAQPFASVVIGRFNEITGTTDSWVNTEPLFVCGNGSDASTTSNALTLYKNGNMTIAGTLTQNSDIRLKENIVPLNHALGAVAQITPVHYDFKDKTSHPAERQIGFIAQEIEPFFPELVSKDAQGMLSVDYSKMTAVLLQAVKEQQAIIQEKSAELCKAEVRITELEIKFAEMQNLITQITQTQEKIKLAENN